MGRQAGIGPRRTGALSWRAGSTSDNDGSPRQGPYAPGHIPETDRTALDPNAWNGPPDRMTVADILAAVKQFNHNCS